MEPSLSHFQRLKLAHRFHLYLLSRKETSLWLEAWSRIAQCILSTACFGSLPFGLLYSSFELPVVAIASPCLSVVIAHGANGTSQPPSTKAPSSLSALDFVWASRFLGITG